MHRATSILLRIIWQASVCLGARIDSQMVTAALHSQRIAKRDDSQVAGTRASELTRRCNQQAFMLYCKRIPEDCSKALCSDCQQCTRARRQSDNLHRSSFLPQLELPDKCSARWTLGNYLDKGANGVIMQVSKPGERFGNYVIKRALSSSSQGDIFSEIRIMSQIRCPGILKVEDPRPCDASGNSIPYSFVMPHMVPNLWRWYDKYGAYKSLCRDTIQKQLSDALNCLHRSNFIHGDFKGDQVLYRTLDQNMCPVGLEISDFGLSNPRTDEKGAQKYDRRYPSEYYWISGHLMDALFLDDERFPAHIGPTDPQSLIYSKVDFRFYRVSTKIDWCAFLFEMLTQLANGDDTWYNSLSVPNNLLGMDCGWMSPQRTIRVVAGRFDERL